MNKEQVVITGMARTPMGSFQGSLSSEKAPDLGCLLYTSPSPRDKRQSRMPSSA